MCSDSVWTVAPTYPYTATQCGDCNDSDPDIYPDAPEICNDIDDDCDGMVDEDFDRQTDPMNCGSCGNVCPSGVCQGGACVPLVEYFRDDDNDTYGLDGDSVLAIGPAAPYTATRGEDCDDSDPDVNPGMPEICCNMIDDDCDGSTDNPTACTFTVTYLAGSGGAISGTTPQDLYNCETGSEVTAVPDTGYHFVDWSDGVLTAARTDSTLLADLTVTANFAINTYTLTYLAGANGSISGTTPQTVNHGASGTAVSAVGSGSYVFSQWSDGSTQNPRTDTNVTANITVTASFVLLPAVTSFSINSGAATTMPLAVTLNNTATNSPTEYMASESASFTDASWAAYGTAPGFTLSFGVGTRTVYFKARNGGGESGVVSDTIFIVPNTVSVGAGTFSMGRTSSGDDATYGSSDELPVHSVTLGAYQLGKYEVTNKEYCDVLNWALAQGYLVTSAGAVWTGTGDIYVDGDGAGAMVPVPIVGFSSTNCDIQYSGGVFVPKTRAGLPTGTTYSMDTHPMVMVSWYGSVAYCNWLSQWQGLTPCYNMGVANWPLVVTPPTPGGYRLPTEAEWERVAAWDGSKHWIYGFISDTLTSNDRCNYFLGGVYVNPLGLTGIPYTSPVAWFNGVNISPYGSITTVNSPSPMGAYDLSGNVWEWCHDFYSATYYSGGAMTNPIGPTTGTDRTWRGGGFLTLKSSCRTAERIGRTPTETNYGTGFRLSRTPAPPEVTSFNINGGAATTVNLTVTLNNTCTNSPTEYMASESSSFTGASWQAYSAAPSFTFAGSAITRTVYFKARNGIGESATVSDTIYLEPATVFVAAGTFTMGRTAAGDDATYGSTNEDPQHQVGLAPYQLGKYEVTNQQYCDVLNWARAQGYLFTSTGLSWNALGDIYAGGASARYLIVAITQTDCNIQYTGTVFVPKTRTGLPTGTNYSMAEHPMVRVSWYGSVAFSNWLSLMLGLLPCYDMTNANWPLNIAPPTSGGYRLPTEAEWERAAAWNGTKHWIYSFMSDTNSGPGSNNRCNDYWYNGSSYAYVNPLGLTSTPYTSPVGWFNGTNVSPNGSVTTVNSPSPVGAYDLSGNVFEWTHDWYSSTYYSGGSMTNPTGPATGSYRVYRGGGWYSDFYYCRSAFRYNNTPTSSNNYFGFRLSRS